MSAARPCQSPASQSRDLKPAVFLRPITAAQVSEAVPPVPSRSLSLHRVPECRTEPSLCQIVEAATSKPCASVAPALDSPSSAFLRSKWPAKDIRPTLGAAHQLFAIFSSTRNAL